MDLMHLAFKVEHGAILLDNVNATLQIPPPIDDDTVYLERGKYKQNLMIGISHHLMLMKHHAMVNAILKEACIFI